MLALCERIDASFGHAVELVLGCKGRLVVTGMGKSGAIGRKIAGTFSSTGTPSLFLHPAEGIHGDLGMVTGSDVVLALSNSGESEEIASILPAIGRIGAKLIAMVGRPESSSGNLRGRCARHVSRMRSVSARACSDYQHYGAARAWVMRSHWR